MTIFLLIKIINQATCFWKAINNFLPERGSLEFLKLLHFSFLDIIHDLKISREMKAFLVVINMFLVKHSF